VIPPGHYYVQGTSADSFDSRYRASGLVRAEQVLGTVVPLF
jgi:conjugal transfer pilin signal peptidase TrbI